MHFIKTFKRTVSLGAVALLAANVVNFPFASGSQKAYAAVIPSPSAIPTVVSTYVVADKAQIATLGEQVQLKVMARMSNGTEVELKKTTASNSTDPEISNVHYTSTVQGVTIDDATGILTYDGSAGNVPVDVKADIKYLDVKYFEGFEGGNIGTFTYDPSATTTTSTAVVAKTGAGIPAHSGTYSANRTGPTTNTVRVDMGAALNGVVTAWFYNGSTGAASPSDQSRNNIYVGTKTTSGGVNVSAGLLMGEHWDGATGSGTKFITRLMSSSFSPTTVNRGTTPAWHEFKWDLTSGTDAKMYIDGTLVGTTTAETKYQYVALLGNWLPNNAVTYYDDIKTTQLGISLSTTLSIPVTTADLEGLSVAGQGGAAAITTDAGTLQMTAAANPAGAPSMVTWKVENADGTPTNNAEISATGLLTAKGNGTVKVTATSTVKPEISDSALITITGQTIKAATITIQAPAGATSFTTLDPVSLSAEVIPVGTADPTVSWAILQGADVASISSAGVLTPVKAGTVQIQATANDPSGVKSNILQLTFDVKMTSLTVTGAGGATEITSRSGQLQMGATAQPGGAPTTNVAWTVENGTGSASISSTGLLKAIDNGSVTVKATAQDGSGVVGQTNIQISGQGSHTFYVSSSTGDDTNDGLSAAAPWKTLNKVSGTTFIPGDKILLKAGDSWDGQLWPKGSGAEGNPIVIDQYGTGNRPLINGKGNNFDQTIYNSTTTYNSGAVFLKNQEYWELNNLEVTNDDNFAVENNDSAALRAGIFFTIDANESDRVYNHIYIRNCYVHDIDGNNNAGPKENGGIIGVVKGTAPTSQVTKARFNDVKVENNTIRKVDRVAIRVAAHANYVGDDSFSTTATFKYGNWNTGFYIAHNTMEDVGGDGIILRDTDGAVLEYNYLNKFGTRVASSNAIAGIWLAVAKNTLIQYNEVTGGPANNQDGCAFDFDEFLINTVYQYNYSHDNPMGFMLLMGTNENDVLRYNVSQNDGIIFRHFAFDEKTTGSIYNNVFYYDGSKNQIMGSGNTVKSGYSFYNNIFYNTNTTTPTNWLNNSWSNALFSNNVFYEAGGVHPANEPNDANKVTAEPKFVNPGGAGAGLASANAYELQPDSPAINAGIAMANNGGKDYKGNSLYKGFADIGAFEYQGETTGVNHRPLISNAKYSVKVDRPVTGKLSASDPDGDQLQFSIVSNGALGTVQLLNSTTGDFVYTPNPGATGNDSFTFKASDGLLDSNIGTVTVAIAQSNLLQNGGFEAGTTAPPPGWTSFYGTGAAIISDPAHVHSGSNAVKFMSNNSGAEQVVSGLTPNTNYVVRGWIKVMDAGNTQSIGVKNYGGSQISKSIGTLEYSEGKIIFKTGAANTSANIYSWKNTNASNDGKVAYIDDFSLALYESPTAISSAVNTVQDAVYTGNLSVSRYDGDALTYAIAVNGTKGTAVITDPATGAFTYTPNPGATGTDSFTFKANDGITDSEEAVITVNIAASPMTLSTELTGGSTVQSGESFIVTYGLRSIATAALAQDVTVQYDANVMEFVSAKSVIEGVTIIEPITQSAGKLRMIIVSQGTAHAVSGNAQVAELTFRAKAATQNTSGIVSISKAVLGNAQGGEAEAAASSYSVAIIAPTPGMPGDLTNDMKVTIGDLAIVAANYGKDTNSPDWEQAKKADVVVNGKIDIDDLAFVASKIE
ncbi:Ig-like domain-containing protein [Paenibacillus anseongense]|uniref:Ig-like domain-containing protein n=1 Tax=Paenibacillus anseongense TaxID=2682845 RepID=UPI002DB6F3EA|nr:Ig-like domain-containing protein [Paenibacillus anseongense]MEC0266091.1 Ig-like domain-containing protein [Paenibacillus anseongense]